MNAATTARSAAALRGDESALYRELAPRLAGLVRTRVHAPDQTLEDACSFAWVALIEHQPARGEALLGWLYVVACREAWHLLARAARIPALEPAAVARLAGGDERAAQLRATAIEALETLAALPERQRRLLAAKTSGYGYRELAAREQSSYTAVDRQCARLPATAPARARRGGRPDRQHPRRRLRAHRLSVPGRTCEMQTSRDVWEVSDGCVQSDELPIIRPDCDAAAIGPPGRRHQGNALSGS